MQTVIVMQVRLFNIVISVIGSAAIATTANTIRMNPITHPLPIGFQLSAKRTTESGILRPPYHPIIL